MNVTLKSKRVLLVRSSEFCCSRLFLFVSYFVVVVVVVVVVVCLISGS
jgi:hypothetical protein